MSCYEIAKFLQNFKATLNKSFYKTIGPYALAIYIVKVIFVRAWNSHFSTVFQIQLEISRVRVLIIFIFI